MFSPKRLSVLICAGVLVLPGAGRSADEDTWIGRTVILKSEGVRIGHSSPDGEQVYVAALTDIAYRVVNEENGWLFVRQGSAAGWFARDNAVPVDDAIAYFTDRIRANDGDAVAFAHRGRAWFERNEPERALRDLDDALRLVPRHPGWLRQRGVLFAERREFDKAVRDLSEAIRLSPRDAMNFVERGIAYKGLKQLDKAIDDYTAALRVDPQWAHAFYNRANVYRARADYDRAIADYNEAIRLEPNDPDAYFNRALSFKARKEYAPAIADFRAVIRLDAKAADAFDGLAWLLATCPDDKLRDGPRAVDYAGVACELSGARSPYFLATFAAALAEAGKFDQAIKWQQHALESAAYEKAQGDTARRRLKLFEQHKPVRED